MSVFRFQAVDCSTPKARKGFGRRSKSPPTFAFSTSPSILQDITMDKSDMEGRGAPGLTMKEYDDQIKKLAAENFQLKLKLYFMETRIAKLDGIQDKDLIKENVELRVDNESKSKELERLEKLVEDSLKAIQQLQQEHQQELADLAARHEREKRESEVRTGALEARLRLLDDQADVQHDGECDIISSAKLIKDLETKLQDSESEMKRLREVEGERQNKISSLELAANEMEDCIAERDHLKLQVASLEKQLTDQQLSNTDNTSDLPAKIAELESELSAKENEYKKLQMTHERACDTIKSFVRRVLEERNQNKELSQKLTKEQNLVQELRNRLQSAKSNGDTASVQVTDPELIKPSPCSKDEELPTDARTAIYEDLTCAVAIKNSEIEKLKNELKKRTQYLQEIVNKDLWDKNKQIEKLEKKLRSDNVENLKQQLEEMACQQAALRREMTRLLSREAPLRQACCVLTERLEELAGFLDSLLADRLMLSLGGEQHQAIRLALDRSRELSRRLTLSFDEPSIGQVSRLTNLSVTKLRDQLSLLSQQLHISLPQNDDSIRQEDRRESEPFALVPHEGEQKWLELEVPQDEELDGRRRRRLDRPGRCQTVETSESETCSEPDRSVSLARMGHIDSSSVTPLRLSKCQDSSQSSDDTLNETRNSGKRVRWLHNRIKHLEESNKGLKVQLNLLESKHSILNKLSGQSAPQLLLEIHQSLSELEETRDTCIRLRNDLATARGDLVVVREDLASKEKLVTDQKECIAQLEARMQQITVEYELKLLEAVEAKESAEKRVLDIENMLSTAERLREDLQRQVNEINVKMADKMAEQMTWESRSKAQVREAARHLDSCERMLQEKVEFERKVKELQQFVECLQKNEQEKQKEVECLISQTRKEHEEMLELRRRLAETERGKSLVEAKVKEEGERIKWMEEKLRELERAMDQCEEETKVKIVEEVHKGIEIEMNRVKREWVPRVDLEKTKKDLEVMEGKFISQEKCHKEREEHLTQCVTRLENEKRDWWRQMNEARVRGSELELELARLSNEKMRMEEQLNNQKLELRKALDKQAELLKNHRHAEETIRNLEKQAEEESGISVQDFVSARNLNSSPDLGIESDQGRFSSLEIQDQRALVPRMAHDGNLNHIESENEELRHRIAKLTHKLEETQAELTAANHHKRQMERAICKQLHKTHHILKKARINFEMHDSDDH